MENTPAKDASRDMFYRFVKGSFTVKELRSARAVVLLGQERREIPLLDQLGISRHRVTCIENDDPVYLDLHLWNRQQPFNQKIELFRYDLNNYLRFLLDREQPVEIFNLDIYGTLQNNILPEFENVIRLCKNQPKTVIGTYLTGGRDRHVLQRAFEPTVFLIILDPRFKDVIEGLVSKLIAVGHDKPVAFNHAFRIMQWVYSMINVLVQANHPKRAKMLKLERIPEIFWQNTVFKKGRLTWGRVSEAALRCSFKSKIKSVKFDCAPTQSLFAAYRNNKWTQLCQFMKLENTTGLTLQSVIDSLITGLQIFYFASKDQTHMAAVSAKVKASDLAKQEVLAKKLRTDLASRIKLRLSTVTSSKTPHAPIEATEGNGAILLKDQLYGSIPPRKLWNEKEHFTQQGRELIRKLAHKGQKTGQIASYFPKETPSRSISALIAISNRSRNRALAD